MRYAMIMAGGTGTRLWPMSRGDQPKQLIPFIRDKSLLEVAIERLAGLVPDQQIYICAGESHRKAITHAIPQLPSERYLGEPIGRDTLNAAGFSAAVIAATDPDAVIAVFTADHVIEPVAPFQELVRTGFELVQREQDTLVTFGVTPTEPATGYGYLQLGQPVGDTGAFTVKRFREKPDTATALQFYDAGPEKYLWNSGMFVWKASTLMRCIQRYEPATHESLSEVADAWGTDRQQKVIHDVYPSLKKISVDFAVMQPVTKDPDPPARVVAVPMPASIAWLDVGSWPAYAETCDRDDDGNALAANRHLLMGCTNTLAASSDPDHLVAAIGCDDLVIIHTPRATLVCPADQAQKIKDLHQQVGERYGQEML